MPIRRGMGGLSSGAGGNLFDRPGFFDYAEVDNLVLNANLLLKLPSETYGIYLGHGDTSSAGQHYTATIPALSADGEMVITTATQTLTNKTYVNPVLTTILDANGNEQLILTPVSSAVNYLTITNSATGNPLLLNALGTDTNIDVKIVPKGSGKVQITGDLQIDGTTTTIDSTTLTVDDKNIEMGSVDSPTDVTADGGGITLKGATDKTIIWDNSNDNWTSNQDWNLPTGKVFKINNVSMLSSTSLGSSVINSSLTSTGALNSGSITSGFTSIDVGAGAITTTGTVTGGQLTVDNITINGNTISSSTGNITFNAASSLDFGDDSILNVGTLTLDAIHGDNNAIQIGDNSDDAVSIYRVNALTAIGDLDIGANDLRAQTVTADGLTAGQVVYTGTAGVLSAESGFEYSAGSNTLTVGTISPTNINAFTLGGKLTAGSSEIEGSAFDINGGTVDAITSLTIANNVDVGNYTVRANNFLADSHTATRIFFAGTDGVLATDSDLTFATDTLTVTKIGAFTAVGSIDFDSEEMTNVNIDSGAIDAATLGGASAVTINAATVGGGLTWSAAQNLNNQNLTNVDIDSGTINDITTFGIKQSGTSYEMQIAVGTGTDLTADRVLSIDPKNAARTAIIGGDLTFSGAFITAGDDSVTLTTTNTTDVTLPTSGTLATLAGNETFTNKVLTTPTIGDLTNATHAHSNNASGGVVPIANTSGTLAVARGGTGATTLNNLITLATHTTGDYVATITGGTGITSSAATSGEGTTHSLSVDASQGQITTVGDLDAGSITSGFTSINVGSGAISTTGTATTGALVIGGDISTAAAQDWDLIDNTASALSFDASGKTGILEIDTRNGAERVTMSGGLLVTGDLTVSGTTTTVASTTVTIADPIFNLGGTSAPGSDDNKDRGISFRWHNGSAAKIGFFGYDDSTGKFTVIPDATINSEVVSGTAGTLVATTFEGALTGNVTGNADTATTATTATNVTATANNSTDETTYLTFVDGALGGTEGIETDSGLTYNPSTGVLTAASFSGAIAGGNVADDAITNAKLANMAANTIKVRNANSTGDPSDLAVATTEIVIGDGTGFTAAALSGDVTMTNAGAVTIATNAVQAAMVHEDVISGRTELTSGVATDADFLLLWDATDSTYKKVKPDNLGVSGLASGSANELQYNNSNSFAGASNVEIKNNSLALKEQSAPSNTSGYGMVYAKTDNELYYKDDGGNETKITSAGALAGGGAFKGVKAYITGSGTNLSISNDSATTPTAWTESYDVGAFHDGSTNTDRFTFGTVGYFLVTIQQEWEADSAGYREMAVTYRDTSGSSNNVILRDRILTPSAQATAVSGGSTLVYVDDVADYLTVQLYQNSGAALNAKSDTDDSTFITVSRFDMATSASGTASGTAGHIQFSDGSGAFNSDSDAIFWDATNNRLGVNTGSPAYSIDATATGTVRAATFTGALAGNATTATTAATVTTAAQPNITSLGTLTTLTVDDVAINGKVITMTGDTSDTTVITAGSDGTLSIVTTDAAGADADIQITADGSVDIDSAGILTLDSGAAINIEPASGSAILLDGTISIDAGVVTGATSITSTALVGALTGNATTATALAATGNIAATGDIACNVDFSGSNATAAATIQTNAVQAAMVHEDVISGRTELTSGVATDADFLLLWDATDSAYKKVKPDNLGVSGTAVGSANEIQYNNSNSFAGASNVEVRNNSLALKEQATPSAVSGFGMLYAKTDNELYYRNDTDSEVKITADGSLAGGVFKGIKAYLNADLAIATATSTTLGTGGGGTWTEVFDVGTLHDGSSNTDRFTFGSTGYFLINIQQEWAADAAGYREMAVTHVDTSNGNATNVILRDRVLAPSNQATAVSGGSTLFYVDDAADYLTVQLYQTSGANLNAEGGVDDSTFITISGLDMATQSTGSASGTAGHIQFSDGSGGFNSDSNAIFWDGTNNRLGVNTGSPSYSIDATASGTIRAQTFTGALTGNVTGTSSKATVTDSTANTNFPIVFHDESDGLLDDTGALRYNPSTGQLLVPNLTVAGTTTTVDTVTMNAANAIVFEGTTADNYETTLSIVDPTADHTQYLINQDGYIPLLAAATTTAIAATPAEINLIDGSAKSTSSITIADADAFIVIDGNTTKQIPASDIKTYAATALDDVATGDAASTLATSAGNITIDAQGNDTDIIFKGTDNSSDITMLTLDGSEAGNATFNGVIIVPDGSASAPSITNTADVDTGMFFQAANTIGFALGGSEEFRMEADGDFHADGDVYAFSGTVSSDIALKENIAIIPNALDKISQLEGVSWDWKDSWRGSSIGLVAQNVEKIFPELVKEAPSLNKDETHKNLNYNGLIGLLVESIKELKDEIQELKNANTG